MKRKIALAAVLAAMTSLLVASNTNAYFRYAYRGGYGGYHYGGYHSSYGYHNPYTGTTASAQAYHNPYTGNTAVHTSAVRRR